MKPLICGKCTACCQWADDKAIRPILAKGEDALFESEHNGGNYVLKAKDNGDCVYLGDKGCAIYKNRPVQCQSFDCRELYEQVALSTFIKVILMGYKKSG